MAAPGTAVREKFWREGRLTRSAIIFLVIVLLLVALRVALPEILQRYVNNKLDESPEYAGQVGDIDLWLLGGGYQIDDIEIIKTEGEVPVPLFAARRVDFTLLWPALLDGALVGEADLYDPVINIVDSENEANRQTGEDGQWLTIVDDLFPLRIDKVAVHQGQLHFQNFESEPPVDIYLSRIEGEVLNLSNSQDLAETMVSSLHFTALAMEEGELSLDASFDPTLENPTFDFNGRLIGLPILNLDNFIKAYAPFDVEAGSVDVVAELAAEKGQLRGYVKPLIHNLDVFKWHEDVVEDGDNPFRILWEGLVSLVAELLENQPRDQVATNIPIDGSIDQPDTNAFVAIVNVLRNAFVEAFQANLENTVSLFGNDEDEAEEVSPQSTEEPTKTESPVNN